jgi:DeoR/GlpR family transcriptional regulator of sugar metabolism
MRAMLADERFDRNLQKTMTGRASNTRRPGRGTTASSPLKRGDNLLAETRRRRILDWLQEEGSARVRSLSEAFDVSEPTIRQDLERLEVEGYIVREHGGAFLATMPQQVQALALHHLVNMDAKRAIGRVAAALVSDGETIIIDAGSTTTEVARNLMKRQDLHVVTNALNIALMLGANPSCTIHMPGGQFKAPTLSLTGEKSAAYFENTFAEKLFLATAGASLEAGMTFPAFGDLYVKRAMIKAARQIILVADSTKINRVSFAVLGPLTLVNRLITDTGIRDEDRKAIEALGIEVVIAR